MFYYTSRDRDYYPTNFDADNLPQPPVFPFGLLPNFVANDYYHDKNKSAFLHATYKLTDQWSFSAGVRYTDETKTNLFQHYSSYRQIRSSSRIRRASSQSRFDYNASSMSR